MISNGSPKQRIEVEKAKLNYYLLQERHLKDDGRRPFLGAAFRRTPNRPEQPTFVMIKRR